MLGRGVLKLPIQFSVGGPYYNFEKKSGLTFPPRLISYVPLYRLDFDIASKPFRAATLALASLAFNGERQDDTNSYYTMYINASNEALAVKDVVSLVYASYVMAIFFCLYEHSTEEVLVHCTQFCRVVEAILEREIPETERLWLIKLWHSVVRSAYHHYWVHQNLECFGTVEARAIAAKHADHSSFRIFHSEIPIDRRWRENNINTFLEILRISTPFASPEGPCLEIPIQLQNDLLYLQIYLENFLFQTTFNDSSPPHNLSTEPLYKVLVQIVAFIETFPSRASLLADWFRCYNMTQAVTNKVEIESFHSSTICRTVRQTLLGPLDLTMIYGSSRLFIKLLSSDLDKDEDDAVEACNLALATVELIWATRWMTLETTYPALIRRSLFWAGLILYKGNNARGNT